MSIEQLSEKFPQLPHSVFSILTEDGAIGGSLPLSLYFHEIVPTDIDVFYGDVCDLKKTVKKLSKKYEVVIFKSGSYGKNSVVCLTINGVRIDFVLVEYFDDVMKLVRNGYCDLTVIYYKGEFHHDDCFKATLAEGMSLKGVIVRNGSNEKLAHRGLLPECVKLNDAYFGACPTMTIIPDIDVLEMNPIMFRKTEWQDWDKTTRWYYWQENVKMTCVGVKGVYCESYDYELIGKDKIYTRRSVINGIMRVCEYSHEITVPSTLSANIKTL